MGKKIDAINEHLFYDMPLKKTDAAFVLGCKSISGTVARQTVELYKLGAFDKIIISGGQEVKEPLVMLWLALTGRIDEALDTAKGQDFRAKETEAAYMRDEMIAMGVRAEDIIFVEEESKHTGANIANCCDVLADFNSVSIITYAPNQRRALGTLQKELPDMEALSVPVYAFGFNKENWHKSWFLRWLVGGEYSKINPDHPKTYVGKYCVNPDIEEAKARTAHLPNVPIRQGGPV